MGCLLKNMANVNEFLASIPSSQSGLSNRSPSVSINPKWRPPRDTYLKVISDASFISLTNHIYGCIIIRDCFGKVIAGDTFLGVAVDALFAEAWVLRIGVLLAANLGIQGVIF